MWFQSKKKTIRSDLIKGMTDIHSHLLPGVDDGIQTVEEAIEALNFLKDLGVERAFLTPHIMADLRENTPEKLQDKYAEFIKVCPEGIELRLAGEYMLDAGFAAKMEKGLLTMPHHHVLVETSYLSPPPDLYGVLYDLTLAGYVPVIAHPERYTYMFERDYRKLKDQDYKLQLNLFSIAGAYGPRVKKNAEYLLKKGLYDYTGSDIHNQQRYEESLAALSPGGAQIRELRRLMDNNAALWSGK